MPQVLKRYIYYIYRRVEICIICKVKIVLMQISITDGIIKQTITNVLLVGENKNDELYYSRNGRVPGSCSSLFDWLNSNQPAKCFPIKTLLINIIGAFVIGLVSSLWRKERLESTIDSCS